MTDWAPYFDSGGSGRGDASHFLFPNSSEHVLMRKTECQSVGFFSAGEIKKMPPEGGVVCINGLGEGGGDRIR